MLWEILVPTQSNEGKPFKLRYHRVWDKKIQKIAGGLTVLQPTRGKWVSSSGDIFHERMIPVRVACSDEQINAIADMTALHYNQQVVMFYKISDEVYFKKYGT